MILNFRINKNDVELFHDRELERPKSPKKEHPKNVLECPQNVLEFPKNVLGCPENVLECPKNVLEL